ncbi:hypothetical protein C7270_29440, partial [Burkholderia thailandensis]|nr:hypothetical protein [Burkholderia thailandensis]
MRCATGAVADDVMRRAISGPASVARSGKRGDGLHAPCRTGRRRRSRASCARRPRPRRAIGPPMACAWRAWL